MIRLLRTSHRAFRTEIDRCVATLELVVVQLLAFHAFAFELVVGHVIPRTCVRA